MPDFFAAVVPLEARGVLNPASIDPGQPQAVGLAAIIRPWACLSVRADDSGRRVCPGFPGNVAGKTWTLGIALIDFYVQ